MYWLVGKIFNNDYRIWDNVLVLGVDLLFSKMFSWLWCFVLGLCCMFFMLLSNICWLCYIDKLKFMLSKYYLFVFL